MSKKIAMLFTAAFMMLSGNAAEVEWGLFSTRTFHESYPGYFDLNGIKVYYYGHGDGVGNIQPETSLAYNFSHGTLTSINAGGSVNVGINATVWIDALYGDVLTDDYFATLYAANNRVYMDAGFFDPLSDPTGHVREVTPGEIIYVSFAGLAAGDAHYYGWLELLAKEDELSLVSSALTYSPGLIVGTGNFSRIPEPSAGMLLLLGLAGLALRRRCNTLNCGR